MPNGQKTVSQSCPGLITTIIAITIILFYAVVQLQRLINFGDPSIMVSERLSYFDTDYEFTRDDGFEIAFGVTAYDSN